MAKSIIIQSPYGAGDPTLSQPVLVSVIEALAHTKRASSVGSVAGMGSAFSAPLPMEHSQNKDHFFINMMIKAPGTDFYLPSFLGRFQMAVEQMVAAQYQGDRSSPQLRSGREYCLMMVDQPADYLRESFQQVANQHFDISPQSIAAGKMEIVDRYIVSDVGRLTTAFYDADFKLTSAWKGEQKEMIASSGGTPRQYAAYEIAHFDSTTPHGIVRGPLPRTRLSLSFSTGRFDDCDFSTEDLRREHEKLALALASRDFN